MMKKILPSLVLLLLLGVAMTGCKPEELTLDPAPSKLEGINDTFTLTSVVQVDNNAAPGTLAEYDVSGVYIGLTPATIAFNSTDLTFSYTTGSSLDFIGTAGSFAFDNDDYPTTIVMNNGVDTYDLVLVQTIRPQDEFLEVELARSCGSGATSYRYKFQRN